MNRWAIDSIFYHIYPLGLCGAPERNDFNFPAMPRLQQLHEWADHMQSLGMNALYLGPVFESSGHGYDTADYYHVDRRLGDNTLLTGLVSSFHQKGIRVILDGVFNHVGRDFWAFRDVLQHGQQSAYCDWFHSLSFDRRSPYNDPFTYEGWSGYYDLVKLNLQNPAVKDHLFRAVEMWIREFDIDGLRLDAADCIDINFLKELGALCRNIRPDFWLMGEIVHGDYRTWVNPETLNSATNYECYKGLYSSLADRNYFEIAYSLNRQFGEGGLYRHLQLYNFADNHDVNRVASNLKNPLDLFPLYCLLFTMPGVPSIYYGSEWGLEGKKNNGSDRPLRPALNLSSITQASVGRDLAETITRLSKIRHNSSALRQGDYRQLFVSHEQLAFARQTQDECIIILINSADTPASMDFKLPLENGHQLVDLLNPEDTFQVSTNGKIFIENVWPHWARIMVIK
jgi:cyclomaltodextrinase / maltogenic alpha-amylase / neopullulanase